MNLYPICIGSIAGLLIVMPRVLKLSTFFHILCGFGVYLCGILIGLSM